MSFVHQHGAEFADLVEIVAAERGLRRSIVEKDYWVTHALWALSAGGFDIWFKGGTSLSKGFGLIDRFSEDLDIKLEPGAASLLPRVSNWKSEGKAATAERKAYFESLAKEILIPDCRVELDLAAIDKAWRGASFRVSYPSLYPGELPPAISGHVLLEVGEARVAPFVARDIGSWVHHKLGVTGLGIDFDDNRACGMRCVHPLVTLLEKLDALHRRFATAPAPTFVRHYEDAARLVAAVTLLPPLDGYENVRTLAREMLTQRQLAATPTARDLAFLPSSDDRWAAIRRAHDAIAPMFWGPRLAIAEACSMIRDWIVRELD